MKSLKNCGRPQFSAREGFTLAELLVALAVLGVISTFTIPKVLNAQQDNKKYSILKETLATLSDVTYQGIIQGQIVKGATNWNNTDYQVSHINYTRYCADGLADGCWPAPDNFPGQTTQKAVVLHSGAVIGGLGNAPSTQNYENLILDWNGMAGPNIAGDDQMLLRICYASSCPGGQRPGTVVADNSNAPSVSLYEQVFSR
jgi:prepilin-type N-terminal cleavage/methylation domain-containing protein